MEGTQEQAESLEDIKERIVNTLDGIDFFMSDETNSFHSKLSLESSWALQKFTEKDEKT
jgi:hypothetical protein